MAEYEVIVHFTDLHDDDYPYAVGAKYPREGYEPSKERIEELSGCDNRQGKPLIKAVKAEKAADDGTDNHSKRTARANNRRSYNRTVR